MAHALERKLKPDSDERLARRQWGHLLPQARHLKETVLAAAEATGDAGPPLHVAVPGEGAALFAASLDATITAAEVRAIVQDGFFPLTAVEELPRARRTGLFEIGLPYASDTAVSRHLAAFLRDRLPVDAVLFAGGSLRPPALRERLLALIESWQGRRPVPLVLPDLNVAIAEGAARYAALADDSRGRIRGGYPHSVYVELQGDDAKAAARLVCVLPQDFEAGARVKLAAPTFELTVNRPVRFAAYTSRRRAQDAPGDLVALDRQAFHPLPPLQRRSSRTTPASARARPRRAASPSNSRPASPNLACSSSPSSTAAAAHAGTSSSTCAGRSQPTRPSPRAGLQAPASARRRSQQHRRGSRCTSAPGRRSTPRSTSRHCRASNASWGWSACAGTRCCCARSGRRCTPGIARRGRSLDHENAWLYLAGFVLRPGYGSDLDAWAVEQLWECFDLGLVHRKDKSTRTNWWMMWRRIAGGLPAPAQERLFDSALPELRRPAGEFVEGARPLGSLERVAIDRRLELAALLFDRVAAGKAQSAPHVTWALARLLSRTPLYTAADSVVPAAVVEEAFNYISQ